MESINKEYQNLYQLASETLENSYSPYSNFKVGAALLTDTGEVFTGVNVENASYGAAICAERTAACKAISEGFRNFKAIAIAGFMDNENRFEKAWPCGICRQFLYEFNKDIDIITGDSKENLQCMSLDELLVNGFTMKK